MKEKILTFLKTKLRATMHDICVYLNVKNKSDVAVVKKVIKELLDTNKIIHAGDYYGLIENFTSYTGEIEVKQAGYGFVSVEGLDSDVFIPEEYVNDSHTGDTVKIVILPRFNKYGKKDEGCVVEIIDRKIKKIVGVFDGKKIIPDDTKIDYEIRVNKGQENGAVKGHKVVAIPTSFHFDYITCKIEKILGHVDDPHVDILSLCEAYEIPYVFPKEVIEEIKEIPDHVLDSEIEGRIDYRDLLTITIDGDDAKDLDDGISLEYKDDKYTLYVHIMDVSHYVLEDSPLDKEAFFRGTSCYLADTVIPMLPHYLSNGICSLNGDVDRLTITCKMVIDKKGFVIDSKIEPTIIHSNYRMTYKNVNKILDGDSIYPDLHELVFNSRDLARILKNRRMINGSIEFETVEPKIICDPDGNVLEVKPHERGVAESIIEEFMLIANQTVAKTIKNMNLPFLYRIHENPDPTKMAQMIKILKGLSINPHKKADQISQFDLQKLLKTVPEDKKAVTNSVLLRCMMKARYSKEPLGHYGLAFQDYTHFTSPIRRYPDLTVHRLLRKYLFDYEYDKAYYNSIDEIADWTSKTERRAVDCERDVDKMKSAEYMEGHIGEEYTGLISGIANYGIYVMLDNTIEGLISIHSIKGRYIYNDEFMQLVNPYNGHTFRIGDKLNVVCVKASKALSQIDFELKEE